MDKIMWDDNELGLHFLNKVLIVVGAVFLAFVIYVAVVSINEESKIHTCTIISIDPGDCLTVTFLNERKVLTSISSIGNEIKIVASKKYKTPVLTRRGQEYMLYIDDIEKLRKD